MIVVLNTNSTALTAAAITLAALSSLAATVTTVPPAPSGCDPVTVVYDPAGGPLASASPVYIHVGRNGWRDVANPDPAMTWNGTNWTFVYYPQPGTEMIDCVFNDGGGTWDNNSGSDWHLPVNACGFPDHLSVGVASPVIASPPGTNQNAVGETFGLSVFEGELATIDQGGFGAFGELFLNADSNHLYIGARNVDIENGSQFQSIFLDVDTLTDDRLVLWNQSGPPNGLDHLHNVSFESPMDIAILIGNEFGDGIYTNFNLPDGTNVGQGLFYLSDDAFTPVGGALLTQFDSEATTSADDDGDPLTDRWTAAIPWASLNASGIDDISMMKLCGVITTTEESGNDRYLSANFLGVYSNTPYGTDTNRNVGFNFMILTPITVVLPASTDGEQILAVSTAAGSDIALTFTSPTGTHHRIYRGAEPNGFAIHTTAPSAPETQTVDLSAEDLDTAVYAVATHPELVDLKLMSFNIRYGSANDGVNNWTNRRDQVYDLLNREDAEIIGIQEAERFQLDEILANVPGYGEVGEGRNGGTSGEYSPILYRTSLFTVLDSDTFWLSDTPDVVGSMSWSNTLPRICTWAKLRHTATGRILFHFNTHLDHASQYSREQSMKLIASRIAARSDTNHPFALTGDFNAGEGNVVIQYAHDLGTLDGATAAQDGADMFDVFRARHPFAGDVGTIHGFTGDTSGDKIDYIFFSEAVPHYDARILHDNIGGAYPSDHFPVTARFLLW